jgi:hypothetical protein
MRKKFRGFNLSHQHTFLHDWRSRKDILPFLDYAFHCWGISLEVVLVMKIYQLLIITIFISNILFTPIQISLLFWLVFENTITLYTYFFFLRSCKSNPSLIHASLVVGESGSTILLCFYINRYYDNYWKYSRWIGDSCLFIHFI